MCLLPHDPDKHALVCVTRVQAAREKIVFVGEPQCCGGARQCVLRKVRARNSLQVEKPSQLLVGVEYESVGALGPDLRGLRSHICEELRLNIVDFHSIWTDREEEGWTLPRALE
jgi:hypothetical protein